jgi:hypothetical protein
MKRKKKPVIKPKKDNRPAWTKIAGGLHRHHDGQVVPRGGILYAEEWEFGEGDRIRCLFEPLKMKKRKLKIKKEEKQDSGICLDMVPTGTDGKFDIINTTTNEIVNDIPLSEEDAITLLKDSVN